MSIWKKKKKDAKSVSENLVRIEVFRLLGGNVPYSIAKFEATQVRDSDNNLVLIESSNSFKDDVDITKNKLIENLKERLELHKLDLPARVKAVEKRIVTQQDFLSKVKDGYTVKKIKDGETGKAKEIKVKVNKLDEECRLREYQALLDVLKNDGEGSYETVDSDGLKRIFYLYKEGILIPYKFIKAKTTLYPDISTKRKLYKENQDLIDQDFFNDNKGFFSGWKRWVGVGIMLLWMISLIYWSVNLNSAYSTFDEGKSEEYGTKCAYWCSTIAEETKTFISEYNLLLDEREKSSENATVSIG